MDSFISLAIDSFPATQPLPQAQPLPQRPKVSALAKWRLKKAADYVEAHLDESIRLADLAGAVGLTRMHFAAQFRAATGLRPHEFMLRKRVDRAKTLLSTSNAPLVDVALSVGFQTQAHFTTVFKRFAGETPLRWRRASCNDGSPEASQPAYWMREAA